MQTSLDTYQWEKRPVLVFAPTMDDARMKAMAPEGVIADGVGDRDIALIFACLEQTQIWQSEETLDDAPAALRQKYNVETDQFMVILIGKDGGEKERWFDVPDWRADIFPEIDSMPMRRREMQESE